MPEAKKQIQWVFEVMQGGDRARPDELGKGHWDELSPRRKCGVSTAFFMPPRGATLDEKAALLEQGDFRGVNAGRTLSCAPLPSRWFIRR